MSTKNSIKKIFRLFIDSDFRFLFFAKYGFLNHMDDKKYISRLFKINMGFDLNLENPQTFNEKLQWLKLYDRKPIYTTMVDKYEAKKYAADLIGEEYIIPTIGAWDSVEDIDFDSLPNQFVLKCTHDSHGLVICRDKKIFDIKDAKKKLRKALKRNYYYAFREWPYKNVPPRIIAEKYMEDKADCFTSNGEIMESGEAVYRPLKDYKIYTFNGAAKICMINQDRGIHIRADYFDRDYNWLDFTWAYDHADICPEKPKNYELMYELAEKLAAGTTELRVDLYEVNGRVYFGELTFFDGSGFDRMEPIEWDYKLGSMVALPER